MENKRREREREWESEPSQGSAKGGEMEIEESWLGA
jgi:hypothetical protein